MYAAPVEPVTLVAREPPHGSVTLEPTVTLDFVQAACEKSSLYSTRLPAGSSHSNDSYRPLRASKKARIELSSSSVSD